MAERFTASFEFKNVEDVPVHMRAAASAMLSLLRGLDYDEELSVLTSLIFDSIARLHGSSDGGIDPGEVIEEVTSGLHAMWARYQLVNGATKQ